MSLRYAILVALNSQDGSGYEIAHKFDASIGFFWKANHQQIYQELAALTDLGWIDYTKVKQKDKPDKKIYTLKKTGLKALKDWLLQPCPPTATKNRLLIKCFAGHLIGPTEVLAEIDRHAAYHKESLQAYLAIEKVFLEYGVTDGGSDPREKYAYATLRLGILTEKAWLQWSKETQQLLQQ